MDQSTRSILTCLREFSHSTTNLTGTEEINAYWPARVLENYRSSYLTFLIQEKRNWVNSSLRVHQKADSTPRISYKDFQLRKKSDRVQQWIRSQLRVIKLRPIEPTKTSKKQSSHSKLSSMMSTPNTFRSILRRRTTVFSLSTRMKCSW